MVLYVNGVATTSGIRAGFADCLGHTGRLVFGQNRDFTAGNNLGMEQDTVAMYNRAWVVSEIYYGRRYVVSDDSNLHALWRDSSGKDNTDNEFDASIRVSSSGSGIAESIYFGGWSYRSAGTTISWIFPDAQSAYYFSTSSSFLLPSKYTIETWIMPYSTSKSLFWYVS
jgi:hypothetical protein